jgi:hypothetical protein
MLVLLIFIRYRLVLKKIVDRLVRQSVQARRKALRVPNNKHLFRPGNCRFDNVRGQQFRMDFQFLAQSAALSHQPASTLRAVLNATAVWK